MNDIKPEIRDAISAARLVIADARREIDSLEKLADDWADHLETVPDPSSFAQFYVVDRMLEKLREVEHMPTGGTRHMNYRHARDGFTKLLAFGRGAGS